MAATLEKIITDWKKKSFSPVYWFEGDEDFYIDELTDFAEEHLLSEEEKSFNLTIFYGKDADWREVINACKRYPMFAERQVVIVKEAQQMKDLEELAAYITSPLSSTILVVAHKQKTLDKRKSMYKLVNSKSVYYLATKITDDLLPAWIKKQVESKGFEIKPKSLALLQEHIGNDLNRISNEIDKIIINLEGKKTIDENDIEAFIGISKEYNIFELQSAIAAKDRSKAIRIIKYFESNPKAASIHYIIPTLYAMLSKTYAAFGMKDKSDAALKPLFYYNSNSLQQGKSIMKSYGQPGVENMLLLLHHYNLKSLGVGSNNTSDAALLTEMVVKMMM